jgi:hypothetical protein
MLRAMCSCTFGSKPVGPACWALKDVWHSVLETRVDCGAQQPQRESRIQQCAHPPFVLQGVLHGALRANNVLLTAQRRYQVADYALQDVKSSTSASGSNAQVGTVLWTSCSALCNHCYMVFGGSNAHAAWSNVSHAGL